jgi:hypothetical protein
MAARTGIKFERRRPPPQRVQVTATHLAPRPDSGFTYKMTNRNIENIDDGQADVPRAAKTRKYVRCSGTSRQFGCVQVKVAGRDGWR